MSEYLPMHERSRRASVNNTTWNTSMGAHSVSATTAGTSMSYSLSTANVGGTYTIQLSSEGPLVTERIDKNIESAVYAHIQAVRALGRTMINTAEISKALGLPLAVVDSTVESLKKRGVRVAA